MEVEQWMAIFIGLATGVALYYIWDGTWNDDGSP